MSAGAMALADTLITVLSSGIMGAVLALLWVRLRFGRVIDRLADHEKEQGRQLDLVQWQHLEMLESSFRLGHLLGQQGYSARQAWDESMVKEIVRQGKQKLTRPVKIE